MVYKITNSPLAKFTLYENIKYLEDNWSEKVIVKFLIKVKEVTRLIKKNPIMFPVWNENKNIRKVIIVPQITMFYKVNKTTIDVILFWNNYQNPEKLKEYLK